MPQFYLRFFANEGEQCVRAYNIARRQHVARASIRGQCHRPYYYGADRTLESVLADLERDVAPVFRAIVADERLPSTDKQFMDFVTFAMIQWSRTPAAARQRDLFLTAFMRAFMRSHPGAPDHVKQNLHLVEMHEPDAVVGSTLDGFRFTPALFDLRMKVIRNETEDEFVTSDAPVVFHNEWARGVTVTGTIGCASAGLQVLIPVGPKYLACLYDHEVYRLGSTQAGIVRTSDRRFVGSVNALVMAHAEENLYYRAAATAGQVDALPWELRRPREESVEAHRFARSTDVAQRAHPNAPRRELIMTFRRAASVSLGSSVFQVHRKQASVRLHERAGRMRRIGGRIAEAIGPKERRPPSAPPGTTYTRID